MGVNKYMLAPHHVKRQMVDRGTRAPIPIQMLDGKLTGNNMLRIRARVQTQDPYIQALLRRNDALRRQIVQLVEASRQESGAQKGALALERRRKRRARRLHTMMLTGSLGGH
jgi:hypothetical protein